jgi:hypothetical protein
VDGAAVRALRRRPVYGCEVSTTHFLNEEDFPVHDRQDDGDIPSKQVDLEAVNLSQLSQFVRDEPALAKTLQLGCSDETVAGFASSL